MKPKMKNILLISAIFSVPFFSCQSPPPQEAPKPDLDQLRTKVQKLEDAYAEAQNSKNAEAVMVYYADDAKSLPDGKPIVEGKSSIRELTLGQMDQDTTGSTVRFEVVDILADGDLVVEVGKSVSTFADGRETTGKYVAVFENRDGQLVCVRDIWNRDAPPESVAPME